VSGVSVFIHGACTENRSNLQNWVVLSVTEAELVAATTCAQSMLFHYRLLVSMGLTVELPMILECDNKGAKDLANNWSAGGRMRHVDVRQFFLRDLKEDGSIKVKWIPTEENSTDMFTKNLYGPLFEKHARTYVGWDIYMQHEKPGEGDNGWKSVPKKGEVVKKKGKANKKQKLESKPKVERENARGESVGGHSGSGHELGMVSILDTMNRGSYRDRLLRGQESTVQAVTVDGDAFDGGIKVFEYEEIGHGKIDSPSEVLMAAETGTKIHRGETQNGQIGEAHVGFSRDMMNVETVENQSV
jgi:hypothetical protein